MGGEVRTFLAYFSNQTCGLTSSTTLRRMLRWLKRCSLLRASMLHYLPREINLPNVPLATRITPGNAISLEMLQLLIKEQRHSVLSVTNLLISLRTRVGKKVSPRESGIVLTSIL